MSTAILLWEQTDSGRSIVEVVQPLPHNAGMWARRLRGEAKLYARLNPDNTYHLTDGKGREFFRGSI